VRGLLTLRERQHRSAAAWAGRAAVTTAAQLRARRPLQAVSVPPAPHPDARSTPVVMAVLDRLPVRCLVTSLVLQRWWSGLGVDRDLVVGVRTDTGFRAHAWLAGDPQGEGWHELRRLPARG
jgi:hypothetical protein